MDKLLYDRGLAKRRHVLGDSYVDRALANVNDFNREFQQTEYYWGEVWFDETLSPRERSILTLGMVAALGKMGEFANHVRGARANGLTPNDLRAVLIQSPSIAGFRSAQTAFRWQKTF
jgi:4-carboxymuconolactone decarboxylase